MKNILKFIKQDTPEEEADPPLLGKVNLFFYIYYGKENKVVSILNSFPVSLRFLLGDGKPWKRKQKFLLINNSKDFRVFLNKNELKII